jgi:hypothetical protein
MEREILERAAMVLAKTDYSRVTGKATTEESLRHDIDSLFGPSMQSVTDDPAMNFYRGFKEIVGPLQEQGLSLEQMLECLLGQLKGTLSSYNLSGEN